MPRQPRLDLPDFFYHVFARGIERRNIFTNQRDYEDFLKRLQEALEETGLECLAWCLMPNHFHLLIHRKERPLSDLMRKLMTGYSVSFNLRHQRVGHLFQNRYKAVLCEKGGYFLQLVRYIHLNPLKAGLVKDMEELRRYPWCGHAAILGEAPNRFQSTEAVLEKFSEDPAQARRLYRQFLSDGIDEKKDFMVPADSRHEKSSWKEPSDERILGTGKFVEEILRMQKTRRPESPQWDRSHILNLLKKELGISKEDLSGSRRDQKAAEARALYCYLAKEHAMVSGKVLEEDLNRTSGAISHLIQMGRMLAEQDKNKIEQWLKLLSC